MSISFHHHFDCSSVLYFFSFILFYLPIPSCFCSSTQEEASIACYTSTLHCSFSLSHSLSWTCNTLCTASLTPPPSTCTISSSLTAAKCACSNCLSICSDFSCLQFTHTHLLLTYLPSLPPNEWYQWHAACLHSISIHFLLRKSTVTEKATKIDFV